MMAVHTSNAESLPHQITAVTNLLSAIQTPFGGLWRLAGVNVLKTILR